VHRKRPKGPETVAATASEALARWLHHRQGPAYVHIISDAAIRPVPLQCRLCQLRYPTTAVCAAHLQHSHGMPPVELQTADHFLSVEMLQKLILSLSSGKKYVLCVWIAPPLAIFTSFGVL